MLRALTGMVGVTGGRIGVIDTENNRALAYAPNPGEKADPSKGTYDFEHLPFSPPFDSLSYLDAVRFLISKGCTAIGIDSMSHEHDGIGGVLEQHEEIVEEMHARALERNRDARRDEYNLPAWGPPKTARRHMIQSLLQLGVNVVFCFRAKEKLKMGSKVDKLGWMPIAAEELVFEMTLQALMMPGAKGVPNWNPSALGEKTVVKLPGQFEKVFRRARQVDEEMGAALATWGLGAATPEPSQAAEAGTATERAPLIKAIGEHRNKLGWTPERFAAWRVEVFGPAGAKGQQLTAQQLTDAQTLLDLLFTVGQDEYDAELASLRELGRAAGTVAP
ncbi:MAG: hypothetical protein V4537_14380 [Pseudomonadota bacterium]